MLLQDVNHFACWGFHSFRPPPPQWYRHLAFKTAMQLLLRLLLVVEVALLHFGVESGGYLILLLLQCLLISRLLKNQFSHLAPVCADLLAVLEELLLSQCTIFNLRLLILPLEVLDIEKWLPRQLSLSLALNWLNLEVFHILLYCVCLKVLWLWAAYVNEPGPAIFAILAFTFAFYGVIWNTNVIAVITLWIIFVHLSIN